MSVVTSLSPDYLAVVSIPITATVALRPPAALLPVDRMIRRLQPAFALPDAACQILIRGTSGRDDVGYSRQAWH